MSVDWRTISREQTRDRIFEYELSAPRPLSPATLTWLTTHGKAYRDETLKYFGIRETRCVCYQRAFKRKRSVWCEDVITIPAGLVTRIYRFECRDKADRWRVTPTGFPPQWIGELTGPDVLLCEGEWDCLCAFDHGFTHAATHTGGAGTWLPSWTKMFSGKDITICFDRDETGMRGAAKVAKSLWPVAASVRLVDLPLPGTPDAKDVSDFFRLGGTADEFRVLLRGARHYACRSYSTGRGASAGLRRADLLPPSG